MRDYGGVFYPLILCIVNLLDYVFTTQGPTILNVTTLNESKQFGDDEYDFVKEMCRERYHRMDWKEILKPCEGKLSFSSNIYSDERTNAKLSVITKKIIRKAGEYSTFRIKSYNSNNQPKVIGGDTWRVFLQGVSFIEPYVYDLNNGEYDINVLIMESGRYKVTFALEGSLCSSFVNPPRDWFKKGDYNGHFQSSWQYKNKKGWSYLLNERIWKVLANFFIQVPKEDTTNIQKNLAKLINWQKICGLSKCNFLADGLGRWTKQNKWKPYINSTVIRRSHEQSKRRRHLGTFWVYGDCYAYHFWQSIKNQTLCTQQFKTCNSTYNWIYPRWHPDPKKDKSIHLKRHYDMDIQWLVKYFRHVMDMSELNNINSGMLLNLGLHFIRSASFDEYMTVVNKYIEVIKKHKTHVIWRTTTSVYRAEKIAHKRFQTNQRALLFNAYAMASMCSAGIPIVDVFPMTSSYPWKPLDGIHYDINLFQPITEILKKYFTYV